VSPGRILAAAAAGLVMLLLCTAGLASCGLSLTGTGLGCDHRQDCPAADALARFDDEQVTNAALIVSVGARLRVPPWGQVIAVATAIQESSLRNLGHGDRDSLGLFQQRPSQGWGTPEQLTDPDHAAEAFYRALLSVPRWETMPLTEAAQAVQRSAHPDAYARWSGDAAALVTALTGTTTDGGGGWTRPVHAPVVSTFRSPQRPTHQGTDLAAPRHTIIAAAAAGTVATVACNAHHHDGRPWGCHRDGHPRLTVGCGWYVDITHPDAVTTRYCHLQTEPWVNVGDPVVAGQPIGLVGSTGHSSGPHLHYEVHVAGAPVDPQIWMREHGAPL
jgi:murein DD-endopeptidase MepM/ murein hydrolase activator NlpD